MASSVARARASQYLRSLPTARIAFVPRTPELRKLEGWYTFSAKPTPLEVEYQAYQASGGKMAFSRWLVKNKGIANPSEICKRVAEGQMKVKLTCQYNDILRMSETKAFIACTRPGHMGHLGVVAALANPEIGMLVTPDRAGHFKGRVGFLLHQGMVQLFRAYGCLSIEAARSFFQSQWLQVEETLKDIAYDLRTLK